MLNTMNYREVELLIQCNGYLNGNVTKYIYSATGEKLRTIYQTAVPNITVAMGSKPMKTVRWSRQQTTIPSAPRMRRRQGTPTPTCRTTSTTARNLTPCMD